MPTRMSSSCRRAALLSAAVLVVAATLLAGVARADEDVNSPMMTPGSASNGTAAMSGMSNSTMQPALIAENGSLVLDAPNGVSLSTGQLGQVHLDTLLTDTASRLVNLERKALMLSEDVSLLNSTAAQEAASFAEDIAGLGDAIEALNSSLKSTTNQLLEVVEGQIDVIGAVACSATGSLYDTTTRKCFPKSCKEILERDSSSASGEYTIVLSGESFAVYCDMTTDGGGWTQVMKISSQNQDVFYYNSQAWSSTDTLNPTSTNPDTDEHMINKAFSRLSLSQIRVAITEFGRHHIQNIYSSSARDLFTGSHIHVGNDRNSFFELIRPSGWPDSYWNDQPYCNVRGFNAYVNGFRCRYGITMNNENECNSNDSYVGIGCDLNGNRASGAGGITWGGSRSYLTRAWVLVR